MKKICVFLLSLLLLATACQKRADFAPNAEFGAEDGRAMATERSKSDDIGSGEEQHGGESTVERVIIRTANMSIVSDNPDVTAAAIQKLAAKLGGFVVSSSTNGGANVSGASLTLRIPADQFYVALELLREKGEVSFESVSGQDVTAEFTDLGARLKTQTELENRLLTLMTQAQSVDDMIRVEQELARVRTEIERIQGRRNQIENQAKLSTITVQVNTTATSMEDPSEIMEALNDAGGIMETVVAGGIRLTAALLPIATALGLMLFCVIALVRRQRRKSA